MNDPLLRLTPITQEEAVELGKNALSTPNKSILTYETDSVHGHTLADDAPITYLGDANGTLAMAFIESHFPNDFALHALWGYHSETDQLDEDIFLRSVEALASTVNSKVVGTRPQELHVYVTVSVADDALIGRLKRAKFEMIGNRELSQKVASYRRTISPKGA